ncbi:hypothetical protein CsSME_00037337 [Camellia sinensis var. sinensis]
MIGFHGNLGTTTSKEAELWGVYRDLTIIFEKGMKKVIIKSDLEQLTNLIKGETCLTFPQRALPEDTKFLMEHCDCSLNHSRRKGNVCANTLVNMDVTKQDLLVVYEDPSNQLVNLLVADMVSISCERH